MCSTPQQRIAAFGRAIEDLASQARSDAADDSDAKGGATSASAPDVPGSAAGAAPADVLSRLAELWAELATLDPEVAKRLHTYEA